MFVTRATRVACALSFGLMAGFATAASAKDVELPKTLAWSAYDVGSGGYNQAVAIGNALRHKFGITLRVLPGKNDVSRTLPIREGQVQFSANGVGGSYLAQEGVYEFGVRNWGPQPVRALMLNTSDQLMTIIAAGDVGIKTVADVKGKRVAWVIGAPSLNQNITAILAHANLGWDDVQKVEFGGYAASMAALTNNQVDVAFSGSIAGGAYALAKSPRGLVYPIISHADKEGWRRMNAVAPFFFPFMGTEGADLSKDKPVEAATYPYPVLMTYSDRPADLVYNMTRAMVESYDGYKDGAPGSGGWHKDRQNFSWVIPYHEGAIRYFKEIGLWKPEHDTHNDKLIARQKVLADAWTQVSKTGAEDAEAFQKAWQQARAEALTKAGFDPVLKSW